MKKSKYSFIALRVSFILLACIAFFRCDVPGIDVSEIEFFIAKEWKIESVYKNGELQNNENLSGEDKLENYRLLLNDDFTFSRTYFNGEVQEGTWQLTSGLTQIVLFVDEPFEERWLLIDLKVRRLEMRLLQDPNKPQLDIRYVLEATKGQ